MFSLINIELERKGPSFIVGGINLYLQKLPSPMSHSQSRKTPANKPPNRNTISRLLKSLSSGLYKTLKTRAFCSVTILLKGWGEFRVGTAAAKLEAEWKRQQ